MQYSYLGWLSGKYQRATSAPPPNTRIEAAAKQGWSVSGNVYANERTWQVVDALLAGVEETQKTLAQVALNGLLQKPSITAPILGARTLAHLEDNLGTTGWSLPVEQMARLDQASASPLPFPYDSLAQQRPQRGR